MTALAQAGRSVRYGRQIGFGMVLALIVHAAGTAALVRVARSPGEQFVLRQLKISGTADLAQSTLKDRTLPHDFLEDLLTGSSPGAVIAGNRMTISNAIITGALNVNNVSVPFSVAFNTCTFSDGLDLSDVKFARQFSLTGSTIGLPSGSPGFLDSAAVFMGMKVGGNADFSHATFNSNVDFTNAEFSGGLNSDGVNFASPEEADFDSITAKAGVSFKNPHFAHGIYLGNAKLAGLALENDQPPSKDVPGLTLEFNQAQISGDLSIRNMPFASLNAGSSVVGGSAHFDNLVPQGNIDLRLSHFRDLSIVGFGDWRAGCPKDHTLAATNNLALDGLSFDTIEIAESRASTPAMDMLDLFDYCPYRPQPYLDLEKFLANNGDPAHADETYIRMRRKERTRLSWFRRFLDRMQDALVGYGRKTWKAGLYALALILLGATIFRRDRMDPEDKGQDQWYNPFWYSLDLLSPIDLGVSAKWRAREPWMRNYAQVHRVAGWVLIPLIAAAISGIIQ